MLAQTLHNKDIRPKFYTKINASYLFKIINTLIILNKCTLVNIFVLQFNIIFDTIFKSRKMAVILIMHAVLYIRCKNIRLTIHKRNNATMQS